MKRLLSKQFSNLQAAVALSTHAQNASYIVVGALRYYYNIDSRAAIAPLLENIGLEGYRYQPDRSEYQSTPPTGTSPK